MGSQGINNLAIYTLSAFFPNGRRSMKVEIFVDLQKEEATEKLLDFVHALNIVARLEEKELVKSIEESQTQFGIDPALFADFMPESDRSQIFSRLRAQRLSKFSPSARHQTPHQPPP